MQMRNSIISTHDMATEDLVEYKRLVAEAKEKQKDFGGIHILGERVTWHLHAPKNSQKALNVLYSNVHSLLNKKNIN